MTRFLLLMLLAISVASCNKDNPTQSTYIAYNLNGASCNGAFRIETDKDETTLEVQVIYIPETDDEQGVIFLHYTDHSDGRVVHFTIPEREEGSSPFLLLEDSEFGMGISHPDGCLLTSGVENTVSGVSIEFQRFIRGGGVAPFATIDYLEIYFTGIMTYKNEMNEIEQHTVEGNLVYNENDVF